MTNQTKNILVLGAVVVAGYFILNSKNKKAKHKLLEDSNDCRRFVANTSVFKTIPPERFDIMVADCMAKKKQQKEDKDKPLPIGVPNEFSFNDVQYYYSNGSYWLKQPLGITGGVKQPITREAYLKAWERSKAKK